MHKTLRNLLLLTIAAVALPLGAQTNVSIDPAAPIILKGTTITCQGQTVKLGPKALLLDGSLTPEQAARQPYVYRTFQEAMTHLTDGTEAEPMRLYIAPWVYWLDNPDSPAVVKRTDGSDPIGLEVACQNLHITGLASDPANVVLASRRGQGQGSYGNFTMVRFTGDGLTVENLTMGNFCNVDLEYPLMPSLGRKRRSSTITQAHVAYVRGDRTLARNVRFISRLNMNPLTGGTRVVYDRCHMESTDDALADKGIYLNCDLYFYATKPFWNTDETGAALLGCTIHSVNDFGWQFFTKSQNPVQLIGCSLSSPETTHWAWTQYPPLWLRCYQYNLTRNGQPILMDCLHSYTTVSLEGKKALEAFVLPDGRYNLYNLTAGDDGWDPMGMKESTPPRYTSLATGLLVKPKVATLTTGRDTLLLTVRPTLRGRSDLSDEYRGRVKWRIEPGTEQMVSIRPQGDFGCSVIPTYEAEHDTLLYIEAYTDDGLVGATELHVKPSVLSQPALKGKPAMRLTDGKATLSYSLDLDGHKDESLIDWYRLKDGREYHIATSRNGNPNSTYRLQKADIGATIKAVMTPQSNRSEGTRNVIITSKRTVKAKDVIPTDSWETDFSTFPSENQNEVGPGLWTIDGNKPHDTDYYKWSADFRKPMWIYGKGTEGCKGYGLMEAQQGARMRYTPTDGNYGDMTVELDVDPSKMAGQGFGSAKGQYMDIGLKMDTRQLDGYALRIIRTNKSANAVSFMLMSYRGGEAKVISDSIQSNCFVSGCHIRLAMTGSRLTARVFNPNPLPTPGPETTTEVNLSATVAPNNHGGFLIQHTGTTGNGGVMLHHLKIDWRPQQ